MMVDYRQQLKQVFASGGPLDRVLEGYARREEQVRFAEAVGEALQDELFLVAEAGTGVGKTYGYLVPALLWAHQKRDKVVVSTKTKALQQQIIDRDLPQLERALDFEFKYVEAKGRENYLCWNKYQRILSGRKSLDHDQVVFFQEMMAWAESTRSGDRKELDLGWELMRSWPVVMADRNSCLREKCRYHDKCFRLRMIKSMTRADLIVTNHSLLLSDEMLGNHILPEYGTLIIDEAHTFIKESFDRLALRFDHDDILRMLGRLQPRERRGGKGYLASLRGQFGHLAPGLAECARLAGELSRITTQIFAGITRGLALPPDYGFTHILTGPDKEQAWMDEVLQTYTQQWNPGLELLLQHMDELGQELDQEAEGAEMLEMISGLRETGNTLFTILIEDLGSEKTVTWVDFSLGQASALCAGSVGTDNLLAGQLYGHLNTLVMVSATLAVADSFGNFISRSGLDQFEQEGKLVTHLEHSPFAYERQACLYVAGDMPDPGSNSFNPAAFQLLQDIFAARRGQIMVLFTSRQQLQEASAVLKPYCRQQGLNLLVQYEDGEFGSLMDEFAFGDNCILMGVETFWEGIDLRGDILDCLVIVRLPFRSPSDPYCTAWEQYYRLSGQSSFKHFMLPDAALRFKQGVGRLIRSETDRGVVVVLDKRLVDRRYGQVFRSSIPIQNQILLPSRQLADVLRDWR